MTCSVGIAPNKFLAKIASDMNKPDGLTLVRPQEVPAFVDALPVQKVPGVGRATHEVLDALGVRTLGDVNRYSEAALARLDLEATDARAIVFLATGGIPALFTEPYSAWLAE